MSSLQLHWLAPEPDFAGRVQRLSNAASDPQERLRALLGLARCRADFVQILRLDRALAALEDVAGSRLQPVKLALLGSCTIEHLVPAIRIAGLRRGLLVRSYVCGYGQVRQEILNPDSPLYRFAPDVALLSFDYHATLADLGNRAGDADARVKELGGEIADLWETLNAGIGCSVIQQTVLNLGPAVLGNLDSVLAESQTACIRALNLSLIQNKAGSPGTVILDLDRFCSFAGVDQWHDPARWHQAKQEIAPQASPMYGDLVARVLGAIRGRSGKCLVLDLDNTLWGGVIGDDGLDGIRLGQGSATGEAYLAFQRYLKSLTEHGVILAVCSKNEDANAREPFLKHPETVLRLEDFSVFVANWNDKASNLESIARTLNIGLDSVVFFDDNPAERDLVRGALPAVAVPEPPADPSGFVRCLVDAGYFESVSFTQEDRSRTGQYRANLQREQAKESHHNLEDFLKSLGMRLFVNAFADVDMARNHQLVNKTNQFNLTTRRHNRETMDAFKDDTRAITLQFRLEDKFGDNGIISVVVLTPTPEHGVMLIDTFVMSCRVFGREVEMEIMNCIVERAMQRGMTTVLGEYRPTEKNIVCREFLPQCGFERAGVNSADDGELWRLTIAEYRRRATAIEVVERMPS
jgi:FkbH-like protein